MTIRRRLIEKQVSLLLTRFGITDPPVPVFKIARDLGCRIFVDSLEGDLSGFLYREERGSVLGVNTHHSRARQNFTVAHELGHLTLHDQESLFVDHEFALRLRNNAPNDESIVHEREANVFAASLLMPAQFLQERLKGFRHLTDEDVKILAQKFQVSEQAMTIRLRDLQLVD